MIVLFYPAQAGERDGGNRLRGADACHRAAAARACAVHRRHRCTRNGTGRQRARTCAAAGWPISKPRERSVEAGINLTYGWFQQNKVFVFNDLTEFSDEIMSYSYELDDNYEVKEPLSIKDKASYHLMDCIRYGFSDFGPERADLNDVVKVVDHKTRGFKRDRHGRRVR